MIELNGKYTSAKIMIDSVESECISQIIRMINHEAFTNPVVIMPDCHSGKGSCIGFTMEMSDKVIPNVVSFDIGCGMLSFCIGETDINHNELDERIREVIPFGTNIRESTACKDDGRVLSTCNKIGVDYSYVMRSLGTLGGGNHFIEIGESVMTGFKWVTIHTGSRHLGKKVCEYWQKFAGIKNSTINIDEEISFIKKNYPKNEWNNRIKRANQIYRVDYLEGENKDGYLNDMRVCQRYASRNRHLIKAEIEKALGYPHVSDEVETIHNYIDFTDNIIRKGSIRSYKGERMIIPFSPADGLVICEGKSNPEWNFSAPHGAGRVMSRSKAKATITREMADEVMSKVFSTINPLDESPLAYKEASVIEKAIKPTAKVIDKITPIHNMKCME